MTRKGIVWGVVALLLLVATPAARAMQMEVVGMAPQQDPAFNKEGLPSRIGIISIQTIFDSSPRMREILMALQKAPDNDARDKIRTEQLQPRLNGLKDVVALYAKQNGYPIVLERSAFEYYKRSGSIDVDSLGYGDPKYVEAFIAKLNTPQGKAYADSLHPDDLNQAIIGQFQ